MQELKLLDIEKVKKIMKERNISAEELAKGAKVNVFRLKGYLNGKPQGRMSIEVPFKIADFLGLDFRQIIVENFSETLKKL